MNNEFKKIKSGNDTRYILESASVGSVSVSAVDTGLASPMGAVHRRAGDNLINQENKKSFKMPKRPNNPVAKAHQSIGTGSGEHKKDKNVLARKEKHKKPPELGEAAYTGDYDTDEKNIQHLMRKYHWTRQEAEEHLTSSDSDDEQFDEANIDLNAPYTPSPAKPFRNPPGFNKQGTGVGNKLAQQTRAELAKKKEQGVAEGEWSNVIHTTDRSAEKAQREQEHKKQAGLAAKVLKNHSQALDPKEIDLLTRYNLHHRGKPGVRLDNYDVKQAQQLIQNVLRFNEQGVAEDAYTEELKSKLAEKLSPQDPDGVWIDDFEKADPNKYRQFKNKSPVKKRQMALAAHRDSLKTK